MLAEIKVEFYPSYLNIAHKIVSFTQYGVSGLSLLKVDVHGLSLQKIKHAPSFATRVVFIEYG